MRFRHLVVLSLLMWSFVPAMLFAATGRLVFVSTRVTQVPYWEKADLFVADDDGANLLRLTPASFWTGGVLPVPSWSPDGTEVVFSAYTGDHSHYANWDLFIAGPAGVRQLTFTPSAEIRPSWSPDGRHIAFSLGPDVWIMKADGTERRKITDTQSRLLPCGIPSAHWPAWSANDTIVFSMHAYDPGTNSCQYDLFSTTIADKPELRQITKTPGVYESQPSSSPDGKRLVYQCQDAICTADMSGENVRRLTPGIPGHAEQFPDWSPDGSRIVYTAPGNPNGKSGGYQIWTMNADGSGKTQITGHQFGESESYAASYVSLPSTLDAEAIRPREGSNNGFATATVYGTSFDASTTVKVGAVSGTVLEVAPSGRWLRVRFDLRGAAPGPKDVVVSGGGRSDTLPAAYTILQSSAPQGTNAQIWSEVTMRQSLRPQQKAHGFINVGNSGTEDGIAHIVITLDDGATLPGYYHGPLSPASASIDFSQIPDRVRVWDAVRAKWTTIVPLVMPVASGQSVQIPVTVQMPDSGPGGSCPSVEIKVVAGSITTDCLFSLADLASGLLPGHECVKGMLWSATLETLRMKHGTPSTIGSFAVELAMNVGKCALSLFPPAKVILFVNDIYETYGKTSAAMETCLGGGGAGGANCVTSFDPNDKSGASGTGAARWINDAREIPYSIVFENKPEATAAAQDVIITDQLDASKVDLDTFAFGPVWFDTHVAAPRVPSSEFTADIDLRPAKPLIARVEAALDKTTALVTWKFQSLDPATMLPTTDVLAGFLPPNVNAPEGDGGVSFTVMPRASLTTGTAITNGARIVFDRNAPIDTPVWSNTIDRDGPSSAATSQASVACGNFMVSWSGHDAGSGIVSYDVYVSKDGGPFLPWLERTAMTAAMFEGEPGHQFAFYSIALDAVGHLEDPPASPDVVVTVADTIAPVIVAPPPLTFFTGSSATACGITIGDAALGSATATDNCGTPEITANVPPNNFFAVGTTIITYSAVDAAGNTAAATQAVTVVDTTPPLLTVPPDVSVSNTAGLCGAAVTSGSATATDHCGITTVTGTRNDGLGLDAVYPAGVTTINWSAVDVNGNTATAQQKIVVTDTEAPALAVPSSVVADFDSEAGAAITYTVSSTDNCEVQSVVCSSPSGTLFPIGTTVVTCVAADRAGNTTTRSFDVYVRGARGVKSAVRDELVVLHSTVTAPLDARRIETAIESLNSALDPAGWIDESHIDHARSNRIFNDEKDAANALHNLARDPRSTVNAALLDRLIAKIVACDRLLARVAFAGATDPRKATLAKVEIERGDAARDTDRPGVAIEHYRNAWRHATDK